MTLLQPLTTLELPDVDKFVAKDHFKHGDGFWLGDNFKKYFLPKVEAGTEGGKFKVSKLTQSANDEKIIEALTHHPTRVLNHVVKLAHLFEFLKVADKKEWYIAYIVSINSDVWAVYCRWRAARGWLVEALALSYPLAWFAAYQVFSRDFSDPSTPASTLGNSGTLEKKEPEVTLTWLSEKTTNLKKQDLNLEPGFSVTAEYRLGEIRGWNAALDKVNKLLTVTNSLEEEDND